jgi:membrane-bound lytic murein transglycosylase A
MSSLPTVSAGVEQRSRRIVGIARALRAGLAASALLAGLNACMSPPPPPVSEEPPPPAPPRGPAPEVLRPRAHWVPVAWPELPGWGRDALRQAWPAMLAGCARPAPGWSELCARVALATPEDDAAVQAFLEAHTQPYRVEAPDGGHEGLATGYYEPLIAARREPDERHRVPLYGLPPDLGSRSPYWTRQQLDSVPELRRRLRPLALAWVEDPLDALVLQIQGSGRLRITEPDGRERLIRLAFAGHNGHGYRSVGRWLIQRGELTPETASWPAIKAWAKAHPDQLDDLLWANPRVVFFREEPLPDPTLGPKGAMGVPLTPGRSIAVDPQSVPYGSWVWLDTTEPLTATPMQRLVTAQDTGSAIVGAVRADYFWGWGPDAETQAGRMKQRLKLWVLWPRASGPG